MNSQKPLRVVVAGWYKAAWGPMISETAFFVKDLISLCDREQASLLKAIRDDLDLTRHMADAIRSLAVCLAADESVRTGRAVKL